jgi:hypothetical protein
LSANDTAAFETPASRATSAIVGSLRRGPMNRFISRPGRL